MTTPKQQVIDLLKRPENGFCADCNGEDPAWVSINLGGFLCTECAGSHRSLGSHITKVRSPTLDDKWDQPTADFLASMGNKKFNELWEATLHAKAKLKPEAERDVRDSFIKRKYVYKSWYKTAEEKAEDAGKGSQDVGSAGSSAAKAPPPEKQKVAAEKQPPPPAEPKPKPKSPPPASASPAQSPSSAKAPTQQPKPTSPKPAAKSAMVSCLECSCTAFKANPESGSCTCGHESFMHAH